MWTTAVLRRIGTGALIALSVAACEDSEEPDLDEPDITTVRLTVGSQTINISESCAVTGGPIQIGAGNTPLAATFLLDNGSPDPVVTSLNYELRATVANTALATIARTGAFTGTLARVAPGTTSITVVLFHDDDDDDEEHNDFSCAVPLQVQ